MSPLPTVAMPSFTFHLSPFFQAERSLPSNRMMASDGGSAFVLPGVTTGGSGHLSPDRYSPYWARALSAMNKDALAATMANVISFLNINDPPFIQCENRD